MNLQEIINLTRKRLGDDRGIDSKRLWQDWEIVAYANDAEREIARELELLKDSDTIGYLSLSGTTGQIDSVSVSTVVITSAAVVYATSPTVTAANLADNINAHTSTPNYRAVPRGTLVIIKAVPQTGYPIGGYSLAVTASAGMTAITTNLPGLCRHVVSIGQRFLTLDEKVIRITRFKPSGQTRPLPDFTKDDMDASYPGWEENENGTIKCFIPDYYKNEIVIYPPSKTIELIDQDVIRLPLVDLSEANLSALPEIGTRHHETMVEGIMRVAYRKNDVETLDLARSQTHEVEFNRRNEDWKRQALRRASDQQVNRIPAGFM